MAVRLCTHDRLPPNRTLYFLQLLKCVRLPSVQSLAAVLLTCRMGEKTVFVFVFSMFYLDAMHLQNSLTLLCN